MVAGPSRAQDCPTTRYEANATYTVPDLEPEQTVDLLAAELGLAFDFYDDGEAGPHWVTSRNVATRFAIYVRFNGNEDEDGPWLRYESLGPDETLVEIGTKDSSVPAFHHLLDRPERFRLVEPISIFDTWEGQSREVWTGYPPVPPRFLGR